MEREKHYSEVYSLEEIENLKKRLKVYESNIIYWKEVENITIHSTDVFFEALDILSQSMEQYLFIVDLTNSKRPSPQVRRRIYGHFTKQSARMSYCAFISKNPLYYVVIRFVMYGSAVKDFSINPTLEKALEQARLHVSNRELA